MAVGFYLDMYRCVGCKACQVACKDKNRLEVGCVYRRAETYSVGAFPQVTAYSFSHSCNHCENPACLAGAICKKPDGTVVQDPGRCVGCRKCVAACPYGHPQFRVGLGVSGKCDGCYGLRQAGEPPACVAACPTRALDFGELDYLKGKYGGDSSGSELGEGDLNQGDLAVLPSPSITRPHVLVRAKIAALDSGYKLVNW